MNTKKLAVLALVPLLGLAGFWALSSFSSPAAATGLVPYTDKIAVRQGKTLYGDYCASCHGADLRGEANWRLPDPEGYLPAPPHDETGHTWHHPDQQLLQVTKYGTEALVGGDYKSRMPGFQDSLSDDQILAVLAYIKSTWPAGIVSRHNRINDAQ